MANDSQHYVDDVTAAFFNNAGNAPERWILADSRLTLAQLELLFAALREKRRITVEIHAGAEGPKVSDLVAELISEAVKGRT